MMLNSSLASLFALSFFVVAVASNGLPVNWGIILFPGFDHLDVFGPIEFITFISVNYPTNLSLITHTLDPVSTKIPAEVLPPGLRPSVEQLIQPTHTFEDAPPLDVLLVPGGPGARIQADSTMLTTFIKERYPTLKYLISVCTGASLLARSGVLDGRKATTNKNAFAWVASQGPKVDWVTHARWVVDGNIWTTSGVTSGLDMIFNFTATIYGMEQANLTTNIIEYIPHKDSTFDPFADFWNVTQPTKGA